MVTVDRKANQFNADPDLSASPCKLKILMLHGYTQSGELFHAKTRAMEKLLHKHFPPETKICGKTSNLPEYPGGIQLIYPTAPFRLSTMSVPGLNSKSLSAEEDNDHWAWWTREKDCEEYSGLKEGLARIAHVIRENNGIDGVIGFSQGAAAAAMVTSLLEPGRQQAFEQALERDKKSFPFPEEWQGLNSLCSNGLKFAVVYAGFLPSNPAYKAFFEPKIRTPVLHFIGSLDSVLDESRSKALVEKCVVEKSKIVFHPGGHFVPNDKKMVGILISFFQDCLIDKDKSA